MLDALFSSPAIWFTVPALFGTGLFALKLLLMIVGSSLDTDLGDGHADFHGDHHSDADAGVRLLSVQGVLAFLMGFGWAGLFWTALGGLVVLGLGLGISNLVEDLFNRSASLGYIGLV